MKNTFFVFTQPHWMKFVGIGCILWGVYSFWTKYTQFALLDYNLLAGLCCWGLLFIFFSRERLDDERLHYLKFRALAWSLPVGLVLTHLINYFFLSAPEPDSDRNTPSLAAYPSLVIILLLALAVFHYLKKAA